jgi:nicotinamide-nucleotide amidase
LTDLASTYEQSAALVERCREGNIRITTAESCTGGLIAAALTEVPGSSAALKRAFVAYSNDAKVEMLGVRPDLIDQFGAVSREVVVAMADGALAHSASDIAIAVSGIAGPGGGSEEKPVGLVFFACAMRGRPTMAREERFGDIGRSGVRLASVKAALTLIEDRIGGL